MFLNRSWPVSRNLAYQTPLLCSISIPKTPKSYEGRHEASCGCPVGHAPDDGIRHGTLFSTPVEVERCSPSQPE